MKYEEKFDIVIKAIHEARKITPKGYHTKLKVIQENRLKELDPDEISSILFKVQEHQIIKMVSTAHAKFLTGNEPLPNEPDYYALEVLDTFPEWYANYLMKQKSKPENLDWLNLLKVFDVCSDIDQQIQMTRNATVTIPSFPYPYIGRFLELFPYDSIGTRKSYQQHRWEGAQYLLNEGIALEANYDNDDVLGYGNIVIRINLVKFDDFYKAIKTEFKKRKKSFDKDKGKIKTIDKTAGKLKAIYNAQKGELDIEGKKIKFKKDSFRAKLLELLLKDDKSRKKEWSWDEVIEEIEETKGKEATRENKKKFYPACDGLSKFIAQKIGVNDLLLYNKSTVQINPKYL